MVLFVDEEGLLWSNLCASALSGRSHAFRSHNGCTKSKVMSIQLFLQCE